MNCELLVTGLQHQLHGVPRAGGSTTAVHANGVVVGAPFPVVEMGAFVVLCRVVACDVACVEALFVGCVVGRVVATGVEAPP